MANFPQLTNDGFKGCLFDAELNNIEVLCLHSLAIISPDMFFNYMFKYNNIKVLRLIDCSNFVTNGIMQAIFEYLVCSEELVCEGTSSILDGAASGC
jgi:hypothetical protein